MHYTRPAQLAPHAKTSVTCATGARRSNSAAPLLYPAARGGAAPANPAEPQLDHAPMSRDLCQQLTRRCRGAAVPQCREVLAQIKGHSSTKLSGKRHCVWAQPCAGSPLKPHCESPAGDRCWFLSAFQSDGARQRQSLRNSMPNRAPG